MFYSGILTEPSRKEVEIREAASLRQQRRMKQAVQFIHKDSADLLPLDGLKKLGTSKDTQPHNILQKRLMETNLSKLRSSRGSWTLKGDISAQTNKLNQTKLGSSGKTEDEELIVVRCQCAGKELNAVVDTGSQHNLMSSACLDRLGLKEQLRALPGEDEMVSLPSKVKAIGQIESLALTVGAVPVECAAFIVGECGCAPLLLWVRAGALLPPNPEGKMKLQKHIEIKPEILIFCSKSPWLALQREGGREGG
uniref:Nuclear receptor interacting protein 3 n=1 Tax=Calidris pygmaea TaxID=425635 RepID=A0A8C3J9G3_9CHAR